MEVERDVAATAIIVRLKKASDRENAMFDNQSS